MTPDQIRIVQQTWAAVEPIADKVPAIFYDKLFEIDPSARPLFTNTNIETQHQKLVDALDLVADTAEHLEALLPALRDLGRRHVRYGVREHHYDSVGAALLETLKAGLGEIFTDEVRTAWTEAYARIASTMKSGAAETRAAA